MQEGFSNGAHGRVKKITGLEGDSAQEISIGSPFHDNLATLESREVGRGKLSQRTEFIQGTGENGSRRQRKSGYNSA